MSARPKRSTQMTRGTYGAVNDPRPGGTGPIHRSPSRRDSDRVWGMGRPLWLLLGLSIAFLVSARIYIHRMEARIASLIPSAHALATITPILAVHVGDLELSWQPIEGAAAYRLHIETLTGNLVIDGLRVEETDWIPPLDVLPALQPGEYRWTVEAIDASEQTICKSEREAFRIY